MSRRVTGAIHFKKGPAQERRLVCPRKLEETRMLTEVKAPKRLRFGLFRFGKRRVATVAESREWSRDNLRRQSRT
jgi:hypothetical protein